MKRLGMKVSPLLYLPRLLKKARCIFALLFISAGLGGSADKGLYKPRFTKEAAANDLHTERMRG